MEPGTDADVDLAVSGQRRELSSYGWRLLAVIAAGAILGAEARYGLGQAFPAGTGFPWATFAINVSGGLGMGVLMGVLTRIRDPHPLVRPFVGVGILGGFTTFSTYSTDTYRLLDTGHQVAAVAYSLGTLAAALLATVTGGLLAGLLLSVRADR